MGRVGLVKTGRTREVRRAAEAAVWGLQSALHPQPRGWPPHPAQLTQGCREEEEAWVHGPRPECRCGLHLGWGCVPGAARVLLPWLPSRGARPRLVPLAPQRPCPPPTPRPGQAARGVSPSLPAHSRPAGCVRVWGRRAGSETSPASSFRPRGLEGGGDLRFARVCQRGWNPEPRPGPPPSATGQRGWVFVVALGQCQVETIPEEVGDSR